MAKKAKPLSRPGLALNTRLVPGTLGSAIQLPVKLATEQAA
jgi:hypothetical protein